MRERKMNFIPFHSEAIKIGKKIGVVHEAGDLSPTFDPWRLEAQMIG